MTEHGRTDAQVVGGEHARGVDRHGGRPSTTTDPSHGRGLPGHLALLGLQRSAGNAAVAGLLATHQGAGPDVGTVIRSLPGGHGTRALPDLPTAAPMTTAAPSRSGEGPGPDEAAPSSLTGVIGAFGMDLLRSANGRPPEPPSTPSASSGIGTGEQLPAAVRAPFERSFGYDFSPVRIYRSVDADRAARAVNAAAFTVGDHIVLGGGLDPAGAVGQQVLGHELAHVVQSRRGGPGAGSGVVSRPDWGVEREAESAGTAAAAGQPFRIQGRAGADVHRIAPWLILAGIGLAAGLVIWAASDSPEENRQRHAETGGNPADSLWCLVPVYGSYQQIREADSYFQRVLGVGFLMLDCATLGTAGIAAKALIKAPASLVRTAIAQRGAALAVREGGEIASEAMARETAATFTREGGAVLASQAQASTQMMESLSRGGIVVATEGGLNHAVIYARNAAGQIIKVHGGPTRVLFTEAAHEMTAKTTQSMARRVNAYVVIEGAEASTGIEQAAAKLSESGPAALRWLGGNPTSCGIMQGALLESAGLPTETLSRIVPGGGAAARMLPISLLDHAAGSGGLRFVQGGMSRIVGGTLIQGGLLGVGGAMGPVMSTTMRMMVSAALPEPDPAAERTQTGNSPAIDAAIAIVGRFGVAPVGPLPAIQAALPDLVPGWYVRPPAFRDEVAQSLERTGMTPETAREIVGTTAR